MIIIKEETSKFTNYKHKKYLIILYYIVKREYKNIRLLVQIKKPLLMEGKNPTSSYLVEH